MVKTVRICLVWGASRQAMFVLIPYTSSSSGGDGKTTCMQTDWQ
jgi:hypothetical protein